MSMGDALPIFESFHYLHDPSGQHNPSSVLDMKYKTLSSLGNKFVTFAKSSGYRVYDKLEDFMKHFKLIPEQQRVFHEVIMSRPQKLKFDIDSPVDKLDKFEIPADSTQRIESTYETKYNHILETILDAIRIAFFITYKTELGVENEVICESRDPTMQKFSNHIIIDGFYVTGCEQAAEFTKRVRGYLPDRYHAFIDMSVNKSIQNFRIVDCHKKDDVRSKRIISKHNSNQSIITNITNCEELPDICVRVEKLAVDSDMNPIDLERVFNICDAAGILKHNVHRCTRGSTIIFSRISAEYCDLCCREHVNDHSVFVTIVSTNGVITVFKHCRRYLFDHGKDGNHYVIIGEFPSEILTTVEEPADQQEQRIAGWVDRKILADVTCVKNNVALLPLSETSLLFETLPLDTINIYNDPSLKPFELSKTLIIHANMKMGKTKALVDYINKYFSDGLRKMIIRIISFRQTFSGNLKEKFADFVLYNDVKGSLNQHRLIVQVESLHRLDITAGTEPPDLLILDECESIFEQFDSGLLRGNFTDCFAKFQYLIKFSRHIVCMDAGITNRTFRVLANMRPEFGHTGNTIYHRNQYKNATSDQYFITGDKLKWLGILYSSVEADECIVVPMSSLAEAKILARNLTNRYPEKRIKLYSSETTASEKREHFSDVNTYWSQYDVIIYTPTVSAGVSFEQKHVIKVFGYFTDQSCPVETCIQMIGRIRDVADNQYFIFISARGDILPITIESIKQQVIARRDNLMRNFDDTGLRFEYGEDGDAVYHSGAYFQLWLENTRMRNLSKNSFIRLFIYLITQTGACADLLSDHVYELQTGIEVIIDGELNDELVKVRDEHTTARREIKSISCKRIANACDIDSDELEAIRADIIAQKDITDDRLASFDRYRLRSSYNYHHAIDEKFVAKYWDPKMRRMYKNITRLASCDTNDDALRQIQGDECAIHKFLMDTDQANDLNRRYVFDQHRYGLSMLKLCGWSSINDPIFIHRITLAHNLRIGERLYWDNIRPACIEFGIKPPRLQNVMAVKACDELLITNMIAPINKILSIMYGITAGVKSLKDPEMYCLTKNTLFTKDPTISESKRIPLIIAPTKTINL